MKINSLKIVNFRGISSVILENLKNMVVIAGPNGCGKSCILDAIRLLKSIYGGYQQNEIHQWLSEFQINFTQDPEAFSGLMQDKTKEFEIAITFELQEEEISYLREHAAQLIQDTVWRQLVPELQGWTSVDTAPLAAQIRAKQGEVEDRTRDSLQAFLSEIETKIVNARIWIEPQFKQLRVQRSAALEIIFSVYKPNVIGVIEYNGPKRHYERENVQGVNLNLDQNQQMQRSHHALYNYGAKYSNVKGEMASTYVREALAKNAGVEFNEKQTLTNTLRDLFQQFFPDKQFLGPVATKEGYLKFPVKTQSGTEHDLNELSSGEKEILFGYLRLRNSAPKNSVILLDEPELHLNPRLLRGLPAFYHKNLGISLNNQIWLVTHSDALLRESVGAGDFSVFHMSPTKGTNENQVKLITMEIELEQAVIDLVGDLASYRPGAKVVILEGEDSEFDRKMIGTLFPKFSSEVNTISGGNKAGVKRLRDAMEKAAISGKIPIKVLSITDADLDDILANDDNTSWQWDAYHIENYLLVPDIIRQVLIDIRPGDNTFNNDQIYEFLLEAAKECVPSLVRHVIQLQVNQQIVGLVNTKTNPNHSSIAESLYEVLVASKSRLDNVFQSSFTVDKLREREAHLQSEFRASLSNGLWIQKHRGRDILRRFAGKHVTDMKYEIFRNLIISKMASIGYHPPGMKSVIDAILNA